MSDTLCTSALVALHAPHSKDVTTTRPKRGISVGISIVRPCP